MELRIRRLDTWRHRARDHSTRHRPLPTYWWSFGTKPVSPAVFERMASTSTGFKTLTFQVHVTSSVTWPFDSQGSISYRHSIVTKSLSPAVSEIMGTKHIGSMTLTFQGHVTSSVTWPFDSHGPFPIGTPLSPSHFRENGHQHIGVTTLTFQGHVTSSFTCPLDSGWVISYWWFFGPKSLSLTVSEIFRPKHHVPIDTMLNRHCTCAYHVTCTPYAKFKYIISISHPHFAYSLCHFYGAPMKNKGCSLRYL